VTITTRHFGLLEQWSRAAVSTEDWSRLSLVFSGFTGILPGLDVGVSLV
jgi:hypothetical protein